MPRADETTRPFLIPNPDMERFPVYKETSETCCCCECGQCCEGVCDCNNEKFLFCCCIWWFID